MRNFLQAPPADSRQAKKPISNYSDKEVLGTIGARIGTGKNAKDSFVWMSITWSFYMAGGMSLFLIIHSFLRESAYTGFVGSIVDIWDVFVPIITLALGYAFGKGE